MFLICFQLLSHPPASSSPLLHGSPSSTVPPASLSSHFPICHHPPHCIDVFPHSPSCTPLLTLSYTPSPTSLHGSLSPQSLLHPSAHIVLYTLTTLTAWISFPHSPSCTPLLTLSYTPSPPSLHGSLFPTVPPAPLSSHCPIHPHHPHCMDLFSPQSLLHPSPHIVLYTLTTLTAWISFPHSPSCTPLLTLSYTPSPPSLHGSLFPTVPPAPLSSHCPIHPHHPHCMDLFSPQSLLHPSPHIVLYTLTTLTAWISFPTVPPASLSSHCPIYLHPPPSLHGFLSPTVPPAPLSSYFPTLITLTAWISFPHSPSCTPLLTFPYPHSLSFSARFLEPIIFAKRSEHVCGCVSTWS